MPSKNKLISALILAVAIVVSTGIVIADDATTSVTVGNATPTVDAVNINSATPITLTEFTTTIATTTVTVSDSNGCSEISSVTMDLYRSGIGASACDTAGEANNNNCYPRTSCTIVSGSCTGSPDTDANYTCVVNLQYYADPTSTGSTFAAEFWEASAYAFDGTATSTAGTDTEEVNELNALNVTASIAYGTLAASTNTGTTNQTTTVTNTGNNNIDSTIAADSANGMCTDHPTCAGDTLAPSEQRYGTSSVTYASLSFALSSSATQRELDLPQGTSGTVPVQDDLFWGINIPGAQPAGSYTGINQFAAVDD